MSTIFHMARHEEAEAFKALGWRRIEYLSDESFVMLEWHGEGDPVKPMQTINQGRASSGYRRKACVVAK